MDILIPYIYLEIVKDIYIYMYKIIMFIVLYCMFSFWCCCPPLQDIGTSTSVSIGLKEGQEIQEPAAGLK